VIGVQDEEHVEGALEDRVRLVLELGHLNIMLRKLPVYDRSLSG
jgi:hypothetical protein